MKYTLSFPLPSEQIIEISLQTYVEPGTYRFGLPFWRPGRYVRQDYARNISDLQALGSEGQALDLVKVSTLMWELRVASAGEIRLEYQYYANQLDAGGSYYDARQIYVNPITCALYQEGALDQACTVELDLPDGFMLGGSLPQGKNGYQFEDYHQWVDSPFFAAPDLLHHRFTVKSIPIHLWFLGECQPDLERIEGDIRAYSTAQIDFFGHCPVQDYHYLFYLLPQQYRHGVEHYNSTVIVMGPGYRLMSPNMYRSFLEISSHEFFHTWNVKALRPADMLPYDYSQENYSRLHYITEGVTTYYGDLMLWKSKVYGLQEWVDSINGELRRHYQMGGKNFISLSQASFDSWVNGYDTTGRPNRRISFYTKGYLVSMLLDFEIRRQTDHRYSLDTVVRSLYQDLARQGKPYTREEYQGTIERLTGNSFAGFFDAYIDGTEVLEPMLQELGEYFGMQMREIPIGNLSESAWGLRLQKGERQYIVEELLPDSPLSAAGVHLGDSLIALNGQQLNGNWDELLAYYWGQGTIELHLFHQRELRSVQVSTNGNLPYRMPQYWLVANPEEQQRKNLRAWKSLFSSENV